MNKFLRAIELDGSDSRIYETRAQPGEWTIPGTFTFWDQDLDALTGKARQTFVHGFLGTETFGWTTLAAVAEITPTEMETVTQRLAAHLVENYGAPDIATALPAAQEEVDFTIGLCDYEVNTLLAIERVCDGDRIIENFKVILPPSEIDHDNVRLWGPE